MIRKFYLLKVHTTCIQPTSSKFTCLRFCDKQATQFDGPNKNISQICTDFSDQFSQLTKILTEINSQRIEKYSELTKHRRNFAKKLGKHLCTNDSQLIMVGSLANGLGNDKSDIDLVFKPKFYQDLVDFWTSRNRKRIVMYSFYENLMQLSKIYPEEFGLTNEPECLYHPYIPVITCKFVNGLSMDIQFQRPNKQTLYCWQSLRNTLMIKYYVAADPRFAQLYHWLRRVFRQMGVKNSRRALFSSYQTLMLVLHFLHREEVPDNVLPILFKTHPHLMMIRNIDQVIAQLEQPTPPMLNWQSKCTKTVGELAIELVDYWARFDPYTKCIILSTGQVIPKSHKQDEIEIKKHNTIQFFEPFGNITTFRSPHLPGCLQTSFAFLYERLSEGKYIEDFPNLDGITEDFLSYANSLEQTQIKNWIKLLNSNPESVPGGIYSIEEELSHRASEIHK